MLFRSRRHDDDRQPGQAGLDLGQQVDARATRHADIADQHLQFATRSFSNPRDVLAALDTDEPQVMVSDIRMPGGSGIDLLAKVKARLPGLPVIITVTLLWDRRPMARNTSCIAGAWPSISGISVLPVSRTSSRRLSSIARRISSTARVKSNGLGRYSNAPPWKAETALSRSE